jgi:hypothetical protein
MYSIQSLMLASDDTGTPIGESNCLWDNDATICNLLHMLTAKQTMPQGLLEDETKGYHCISKIKKNLLTLTKLALFYL